MFLRKDGETFVYHLTVRDGVRVDAAFEAVALDIAKRLSVDVFAGESVHVCRCDRELATIKVVTSR